MDCSTLGLPVPHYLLLNHHFTFWEGGPGLAALKGLFEHPAALPALRSCVWPLREENTLLPS